MPKKSKSIKKTDNRAGKPWLRKTKASEYRLNTRAINKTFLIVCEGQTEELYFKSFPVISAEVEALPTGCTKARLVECALEKAREYTYDEVWCVFDMDFDPAKKGQFGEFDKAIRVAEQEGFKCAYSNDAFELWFVLHYQYLDQEYLRKYSLRY